MNWPLDVSGRCPRHGVLAIVGMAFLVGSSPSAAGGLHSYSQGAFRVDIREFSFQPAVLRIERGKKVVFLNRDPVRHDATQVGGFGTGVLRRGEAAAVRFDQRGVFPYKCTLHPYMRGKIVVR